MKAKITLLTVSIAILLTACGQKANGQINAVPPPATAVQEETSRSIDLCTRTVSGGRASTESHSASHADP